MDYYRTGIKITLTTVMVLFVITGAYSVVSLGFGWYGIALPVLVAGGVLWEVWIQPAREEVYRQQLLAEIVGFRNEIIKPPRNLEDAKECVNVLNEDREILIDAYLDLYDEHKLLREETESEQTQKPLTKKDGDGDWDEDLWSL